MSRLGSVAVLLVFSASILSHASEGPTRFGPKSKPVVIDFGDGCIHELTDNTKQASDVLKPIQLPAEVNGTVIPKIVNGTKEIATKKYSNIYTDNREQQVAAAHELAKEIGRAIFDLMGDPNKGDEIQELIQTRFGQVPPNTYEALQQTLEGDSLAALDAKKPENTVSKRTDNALAEIATVLSKFREKTGDKTVDVNTAANWLNRLKNFGPFGEKASDAGDYLRLNYQSAVQVIKLHREVLTNGILYQQHMQTKYRFARQESLLLMSYLDMSIIVAEDLKKMFDEAVDHSNLNETDAAWVNKVIIDPLRSVITQLRDASLTVFGGYLTLGELMDRNLTVIRGLYATREVTTLKMTIGAAGKAGVKKLDAKIDLIEKLRDLGNQIARENVEGLRALGERALELVKRETADAEEMVELVNLLLTSIADIRQGEAAYRPVRDAIDQTIKTRSAELMAQGMPYEAIDKIRLADEVKKEQTGVTSGQVAQQKDGVTVAPAAP